MVWAIELSGFYIGLFIGEGTQWPFMGGGSKCSKSIYASSCTKHRSQVFRPNMTVQAYSKIILL